jgi:hypothetical protein
MMFSMVARAGVLALVMLFAGTIAAPARPQFGFEGHQSSLHATVTMNDGTRHSMTLQGVGCAQAMCSRVRVRDTDTHTVWLDGLASISNISQNLGGPVRGVFTFKDGSSREVSVSALNNVLYFGSLFWTHQLDLANVSRVDFR